MRYSRWIALRKILAGAVLVALAAAISLFIKENLDVKSPEDALPDLTIQVNGLPIAPEMALRAGYEWNFWTTTEKNPPAYTPEDLLRLVYPVDMPPRSIIDLNFSISLKDLRISRADDTEFRYFIEMANTNGGQVIAPAQAGRYMYKIEAGFGRRGSVIYYLLVDIQEPA